jgi:hypothetical protein
MERSFFKDFSAQARRARKTCCQAIETSNGRAIASEVLYPGDVTRGGRFPAGYHADRENLAAISASACHGRSGHKRRLPQPGFEMGPLVADTLRSRLTPPLLNVSFTPKSVLRLWPSSVLSTGARQQKSDLTAWAAEFA